MQTVSLGRLLRDFHAPAVIDYLSLDIEGAEAFVFSTFPWDEFTFLVMTVERPVKELQDAFTAHGYHYLCDHGAYGDQLWVHASLPRFAAVAAQFSRGGCPVSW